MLALIVDCPLVGKDDSVPLARNRQNELTTRFDSYVEIVSRSSSVNRTNFFLPSACDNLNLNFVLYVGVDAIFSKLLVSRWLHLVLGS